MSIELLKDIGKILKYHEQEFRVLSVPAQFDMASIQEGIRDALAPRANNGADGLPLLVAKGARKKAKRKVKAKAK